MDDKDSVKIGKMIDKTNGLMAAFVTVFGALEVMWVMKLAVNSGSIFYMILAFWFAVAAVCLYWWGFIYKSGDE